MAFSSAAEETNLSYREVLRDRRLAGLLAGDLVASIGTGMLIVAMPVETLSIHGDVPQAVAIGLVEAAPFVLSTFIALTIGLGRVRVPPRTLLIADCTLRSVAFTALGVLAVTDRLTLPVLIFGLFFGAAFRMVDASSRRLLATEMAGERGRFAVNGLLGLNMTFALYIMGPVVGGLIVATSDPGVALILDAGGALVLLLTVVLFVPRRLGSRGALDDLRSRESGWRILRRRPVAARLLIVEFFFNFFYMPVEVALPLYVHGTLDGGARDLGLLWGALGVGAFAGAALVNRLRDVPQQPLLVAIIGLWAACPIVLALVDTLPVAMVVFALGGFVYAPFIPVVYSFLQSGLAPHEQQPVVTLYTTGAWLAAPLGLLAAGPLILVAGTTGGLVLSGICTLILLPVAAFAVLRRDATSVA